MRFQLASTAFFIASSSSSTSCCVIPIKRIESHTICEKEPLLRIQQPCKFLPYPILFFHRVIHHSIFFIILLQRIFPVVLSTDFQILVATPTI